MNIRLQAPVRLFAVTFSVMALAVVAFSYVALALLERDIMPELVRDSSLVGSNLRAKMERALALGIPFQKLRGVTRILKLTRETHGGIAYVVLTDPSGTVFRQVDAPRAVLPKVGTATRSLIATGEMGSDDGATSYDYRERLLTWLSPLVSAELYDGSRFSALEIGEYLDTAFIIKDPDGKPAGVLHVGIDRRFITRQFGEIAMETVIVLLVSLLIVFEIFLLIVETGYVGPVQVIVHALSRTAKGDFRVRIAVSTRDRFGRLIESFNSLVDRANQAYEHLAQKAAETTDAAGRRMRDTANVLANRYRFGTGDNVVRLTANKLLDVRAPVFLFVFAEELARPFLPLYIKEFVETAHLANDGLAISAPISIFLVLMGICVPVSILWSGRVGRRCAFSVGALLSTIGLLGTAWAATYWDLVGWRALSAIGYGFAFGACQGHVLDNTTDSNRAAGMAHVAVAVVIAEIAAPSIGGVLADRLGFSTTFVIGATVAAISALLVWRILTGRPEQTAGDDSANVGIRPVFRAFSSTRFVMLVACGAVPAKILLTGFIYLLVPLILTQLGYSVAAIGRVILLVGVAILVTAPLVSRLSNRFDLHGFMVGAGLMICGGALVPVLVVPGATTVIVAVIFFGVGQSMIMTAQVPLVTRILSRDVGRQGRPAVVSAFRLVERLGGAAGPVLAAAFAGLVDTQSAMALLGLVGLAAAVIFSFYFMVVGIVAEDDDLLPLAAAAEERGAAS